jgi:hypothetical protein
MGLLRRATAFAVRRDVDQPFLVISAECRQKASHSQQGISRTTPVLVVSVILLIIDGPVGKWDRRRRGAWHPPVAGVARRFFPPLPTKICHMTRSLQYAEKKACRMSTIYQCGKIKLSSPPRASTGAHSKQSCRVWG